MYATTLEEAVAQGRTIPWLKVLSWSAFIFCVVILAVLCYSNLKNPVWVFGDEIRIVSAIEGEYFMPLLIWPNVGRFWPIGEYDYNFLLPFTNKPGVFFIYTSVKLIIAAFLFAILLRRVSSKSWPFFLLAFLLLPNMVLPFQRVIYPEANLIILFSSFMLFYLSALRTKSRWYALPASAVALLATYTKEPCFAVFAAIGIGGFLLNSEQRRIMKPFNIFSIFNAVIFLILYYFLSYRHVDVLYSDAVGWARPSLERVLINTWYEDRMMPVIYFAGFMRAIDLLIDRKRINIFDLFFLGGLSYIAVLVPVGMYLPTRILPAYCFLLVGLAGFCENLLKQTKRTAVGIITLCVVLQLSTIPIFLFYLDAVREHRSRDLAVIRGQREQETKEFRQWMEIYRKVYYASR